MTEEKVFLLLTENIPVTEETRLHSRDMQAEEKEGKLKLRILMDKYSVEIFLNDGERAMTSLIYTEETASMIAFEARGKAEVSICKFNLIK